MTNFNLTLGTAAPTRLSNVAASKYAVAPRTNQFDATVNGAKSPAWTTEGRGSHYVYFKQGDTLYYVKMAGPGELSAARQQLIVTTDEYEAAQGTAPAPTQKPRTRRTRAKA